MPPINDEPPVSRAWMSIINTITNNQMSVCPCSMCCAHLATPASCLTRNSTVTEPAHYLSTFCPDVSQGSLGLGHLSKHCGCWFRANKGLGKEDLETREEQLRPLQASRSYLSFYPWRQACGEVWILQWRGLRIVERRNLFLKGWSIIEESSTVANLLRNSILETYKIPRRSRS